MKNFYARFKEVKNEIAIFSDETSRNNWVSFQDAFSLAVGSNSDNCTFERMAITTEEAEKIAGDLLNKTDEYKQDEILSNVHWLVVV